MHPNLEEQLQQDRQRVHLLPSEKQFIKNRILAMPHTEQSPRLFIHFLSLFSSKKVLATALCVVVLLVSGIPLTYAAQRSGPGDTLHAFELQVIEPIEQVIAFSTDAQIAYSTDRLEERLDELQAIPEGHITHEQVVATNENIHEHVKDMLAIIPESPQPEEVNHLVTMSALLNAHEDVLTTAHQETTTIQALNDEVAEELSDQVEEYAHQQSTRELAETVQREAAETGALIQNDTDPTALAIRQTLQNVQHEATKGNLEEALQDTIDAKVQALTQDYTEENDESKT